MPQTPALLTAQVAPLHKAEHRADVRDSQLLGEQSKHDLHSVTCRAVIDLSMRAPQAFEWAVSSPAFADRIVATSGTAKTYCHVGANPNDKRFLNETIAAFLADGDASRAR